MRLGKQTVLVACGLVVLLGFAASAWAQGTTSRVTGTVEDSSGGVIADATVTLTNEATNISFTTKTTTAGTYVFESVQVGSYTITVEVSGFKRFVSRGNAVTIGQPTSIRVVLEVGDVAETVEVTDTAARIQTASSGNFGTLVDQRTLTDLPLVGTRGRNPLTFINFQPGVVVGANTGGGVHVHGSRDRAFNFTLDGIDTNESSAGGSNFSPLRQNPDSLAEFSIITGQFTAEYGRSPGAQVTMVTKSGSNEWHGSAFYFYRTPGLNANEWQSNRLGTGKQKFIQHIPGFSLGGPVLKDRTFFFSNLQFLRAGITRTITRTVYTAPARQGLFRYVTGNTPCPGTTVRQNGPACVDSSGNPVAGITLATYNIATSDPRVVGTEPGPGGLDPQILAFIGLTPLPNDFTVGDGLNTAGFTWLAPENEKQYDWVIKLDHVINPRNTIFARWAMGSQMTQYDNVNGGLQRFPGLPSIVDTDRLPRNLAINWRSNPTSRITNEFVFGFNRFEFNFKNPDPNFAANPPFVMNLVTDPITNYVGNLRRIHTWQWVDNFSYVSGPHTWKAGLNFRYQSHTDTRGSVAGANVMPSLNFSTSINTVSASAFGLPSSGTTGNTIHSTDLARLRSAINDLLGRAGQYSQGFVATPDGTAFAPGGTVYNFKAHFNEYDLYLQDTWRVRPNFTLEIGVRWELKMKPSAPNNLILVPNQPVNAFAPTSNNLRWVEGDLWRSDRNNFGPIVGFAWDPFKRGKTSIRGNYRLAYDRFNTFVFSSSVFQSLPGQTIGVFNTQFGQSGGRVRDGLPSLTPTVTPLVGRQPAAHGTGIITVVDPASLEAPQVHQWGLSVQHDVGWGFVVEASYVGRRGHNLFGGYDANAPKINAFDSVCGETFLQAFVTVKAGGNSCLMNRLFSSDPSVPNGSNFIRSNFATSLAQNAVGAVANSVARRQVGGQNMIALSGFDPGFLMSFPQFTGGMRVLDSNDFSYYHGATIQITKKAARGLTMNAAYTFAKSLDNRSFDPAFTTVATGTAQSASSSPWDPRNRALNKARSDFDRRHVLNGWWVYDLPFGRGQRWASDTPGVLERIIGGWALNGSFTLASGRPFTVYATNTFSGVVASPANCTGCSRSDGRVFVDPNRGNAVWWFTADEIARFAIPDPGQLGNTGRNWFDLPGTFNLDLAIGKKTRIIEGHSLEFRLELQNATNTPPWGLPTATITTATFGRLLDPIGNSSRKMQLVGKYSF